MMTIEEFKKIPVKYRLIFIANSLDKYGEGPMREWWQHSRDCFRYLDTPTWKKLRIGRNYMVDVWNETIDNHPDAPYLKKSKESLFA